MRKALALLVTVVGLSCAAGNTSQRANEGVGTSLVVVQINRPISPSALNALRAPSDVVTVLSRTKVEIWRLRDPMTGTKLGLRTDPRVSFVEEMPGVLAAVPVESVDVDSLSPLDRSTVNQLTKGAERSAFRVTAARPTGVTMDLMESALANTAAMPLLDRALPTFKRTSIDPVGTEGFAWNGRLTNGVGELTLVVRPLGVTGTIRFGRQVYSVTPLASGRHLIRRTGPFPPDHPRPSAD